MLRSLALPLALASWPLAPPAPPEAARECPGPRAVYGKVKVVERWADCKVEVVTRFPDLRVRLVESFPDKVGEWEMVESFPDYTVQFVESFPDFTIEYVERFPGAGR